MVENSEFNTRGFSRASIIAHKVMQRRGEKGHWFESPRGVFYMEFACSVRVRVGSLCMDR